MTRFIRSKRKAARRRGGFSARGGTRGGQYEMAALENVAAISEIFHQHSCYRAFYDRYAAELSGFPGIWTFLATAGARFTQFEPAWGDCSWVACLSKFVDALYAAAMKERPGTDIQSEEWIDPIVKRVFAVEQGMAQARRILREVEAMQFAGARPVTT